MVQAGGESPKRRFGRVGTALALVAGVLTFGTAGVVTQSASPASAADSPGSAVTGGTTFAAYVGAGESLNTDFTKAFNLGAGSNTRFRITDPTGVVRADCTILATAAVGASTCDRTGLTGAAGVWSIEVIALNGQPANWPQAGSSYFDWDIIVRGAGGAEIEGRVWTEKYRAYDYQRAATPDTFFWVVTDTGSVYAITMNDFVGGGWAFDSDAYGIVQTAGSCTPRYQSMDQVVNSPEYAEAGAQCGDPYKVFFEAPDTVGLPATATTPSGPDWVLPPVVTPAIDNVAFSPADATRAGTFTYDLANFSGSYSIQIDANGDGDYAGPLDRTITLGGTDGAQSYAWDGRDAAGNAIDPCSAVNARVAITRTDEMHIVLGDTERMTGVTVEQLVGNAPGNTTLYWDDRAIPAANHTTFTPVVDGRAGTDSAVAGGVHGWAQAPVGGGQSWGDHSMIDNWTYSPVDISEAIPLAPVCPLPAAAVFGKQVVAGPSPVAGEADTYDVTYQITVRNPGVVDTTYGLADEFQFGSTVSVVTPPAPAVTAAAGSPTPTAGWNGDSATEIVPAGTIIAPGVTHTYNVTVRVSFPPITTVNTANDCELGAGEDGTGLRNEATLSQPDTADRTAVACRSTGFPNISKSGVVVEGPNTGSTTTAESGDVIEWKVQYQNVPESEGEGVTISDTIGGAQTYVPGSLDAPGGEWTVTSATPPTVSISHPTNGLPTAVGGTAAFPPPPLASSSQAGTGGDGFEPIPFGANVYNIFHHQLARVFCTVKQTGAICAGYPAEGFVVEPLLAAGTPFQGSAALTSGDQVLVVGDTPFIYPDRENNRLWVGGQLVTFTGMVAGQDWPNTGRVGYACIDLAAAVPTSCGWLETGTGAPNPAANLEGSVTRVFNTAMSSKAAFEQGGVLLGIEYFAGTTTSITRLDVASGALLPEFPITWPAMGWFAAQGNFGYSVGEDLHITQLGTTSQFIVSLHAETGAIDTVYEVCYDAATNALCAGWAGPVPRPEPYAGGLWASAAVTTYDAGMNATGYCHVWTPHPSFGAPSTPATITCYTMSGAAAAVPANFTSMIPAGGWGLAMNWFNFEPGVTVGTRTYFILIQSSLGVWLDDAVACYDWATQSLCGAPYPYDHNEAVVAQPYQMTLDDQIPTCMWELGHLGELYSFDINTGGPCNSTTGRLAITPATYYCASSTPAILGWDRIVVHNVGPAEFSTATLTLRDANGDIIPGWDALTVTPDLADGVIDVSAIPYGGTTTTLNVELRFDGILPTTFQAPHPTPSITTSWVGDPIEMCFRTTVAAVCNVTDIDNTAAMAFNPTGPEGNRTSTATASLDYIATSADCFEITKTPVDRTYLGNGDWEITYDIGVMSETAAEGRYTLNDTLHYGAGITVVDTPTTPAVTNTVPGADFTNDAWNGAALDPPDTLVAADVSIAGGAAHSYRATVTANVPVSVALGATADCTQGAGEDGNTGFWNEAALTGDGGGAANTATACQEPDVPTISHSKSVQSVTFNPAARTYTIEYLLTASAVGDGLGEYDLTDTLDFPASVETVSAAVTARPAGVADEGWTGEAPTTLVAEDVEIDTFAGEHLYVLTVEVRPIAPFGGLTPDCSVADGELENDSELTPVGATPIPGDACLELPEPTVTQTKALIGEPTFDVLTGRWTVTYRITETATGEGMTFYDFDDELLYGANMVTGPATVVADPAAPATPAPSATWNGETDLGVVDDAIIVAGETHAYLATVEVALTSPQGGAFGECNAGEDFRNRATLTVGAYQEVDEACGEPTAPTVVLDKEQVSTTYNPATLQYTMVYDVSATATGVGQTFYNITDTLRFGASVDIISADIVAGAGTPAPNGGWNGGSDAPPDAVIGANLPINGGQAHSWRVTVFAELTAPPTGDAAACNPDEDFYNEATLTIVGATVPQTDFECRPIVTPIVTHDKRLNGASFNPVTQEWTLNYEIEVFGTGEGTGFYNLNDELQYGPNVTIVSADVVPPAGVSDPQAWNGVGNTVLAVNQTIAGGTSQVYEVTVRATIANPVTDGDCTSGEDLFNETTLTVGNTVTNDDECMEPVTPVLSIVKAPVGVAFNTANGEYTTAYTVTVTATGVGNRSYNLQDTLDYPTNLEVLGGDVVEPPGVPGSSWDPTNGNQQPVVATNVNIVGDQTPHVYAFTVRSRMIGPDTSPNFAGVGNCARGDDFVNDATLTANGSELADDACIERPQPPVTHDKTLADATVDPATGIYTLTYEIDVAAGTDPTGQTYFDLDDELDFGPNVTVSRSEVVGVVTAPDAAEPLPGQVAGWNGDDQSVLFDDQPIIAGDSLAITIEVDLTFTSAADDATVCAPGIDLYNEATLIAGGHGPEDDDACAELPQVTHSKDVVDGPTPVPGQPGRYTVTYELTETETIGGLLDAPYDLSDELRYGPDVTPIGVPTVEASDVGPASAVNAAWNGDSDTVLVDNGLLDAGTTDVITVTATFESLVPDPPDADATECSGVNGSRLDEDVANTSTLSSNGAEIVDDACVPAPHPSVDHTKTLTGITPNGDGTYTVGYSIVASNTGDGAGIYDLGDSLRYGAGVEIVGTPTVAASAGVSLVGGWNGTTSTALVDGQAIEPSAQQTFTITVVIRPNPTTTVGGATDCALGGGESGTGVYNESRLTAPGGVDQTRTACGELPHFVIDKTITSGPIDLGGGQHQLVYAVTITNDGAGSGAYNLADHLTYGANVTIVSAMVGNTSPGGIATNPGWNGTGDTTVATGVALGSGGVHTYGVTVNFSVPAGTGGAPSNDCDLDPGESGTGLLNTATVNNNGTTNQDTACALVVPPATTPPPPPTPTVPPTNPDPGQLPATGGNSTPIVQIALLLVAFGALVVFATRRNLRRRKKSAMPA